MSDAIKNLANGTVIGLAAYGWRVSRGWGRDADPAFKTRDEAAAYAEQHGGRVMSAEMYRAADEGLRGRALWERLVTGFYGADDEAGALGSAVARMKAEVMADRRLHGCTDFAQLHDFCDANTLGGFCDDDFPGGAADIEEAFPDGDGCDQYLEAQARFTNEAQSMVGRWLKAGRPS